VLVISLVGGSLVVALGLALVRSERLRTRVAQDDAARIDFAERFRAQGVPEDVLTHTYDALRRRLPDARRPPWRRMPACAASTACRGWTWRTWRS
jgi:hypothetical protein